MGLILPQLQVVVEISRVIDGTIVKRDFHLSVGNRDFKKYPIINPLELGSPNFGLLEGIGIINKIMSRI